MAVKKPKTEEKAKGLIGLNKGKKISGAAYSVGNYKGKTLNLSGKELGAAGKKASAARTVKIQDTKYDATSKKVMGAGGHALTGKVDLGGGNMAVYKNGVRVRAAKPKPAGGSGGGGNSSGNKGATSKNIGYTAGAGNGPLSKAMASKGAKNIGYTPGAGNGARSKALAASAKKSNLSVVQKASSGYVRGSKGSTAGNILKPNLKSQLAAKRGQDTRNIGRDSTVLASMALAPLGLLGGGGAAAVGAGRVATGARAIGAGSRARTAIGAGTRPKALPPSPGRTTVTFGKPVRNPGPAGARASAPKPSPMKAIEGPKTNVQKAQGLQGSKSPSNMTTAEKAARARELRRDGVISNSRNSRAAAARKNANAERKAAQDAASRRSAAAKKAAATRAANKAAAAKKATPKRGKK